MFFANYEQYSSTSAMKTNGCFKELPQWGQDKCLPFWRQNVQIHFLVWKYVVLTQIALKVVRDDPTNNKPALVQVRAWRRTCCKPVYYLTEASFTDPICITRSMIYILVNVLHLHYRVLSKIMPVCTGSPLCKRLGWFVPQIHCWCHDWWLAHSRRYTTD